MFNKTVLLDNEKTWRYLEQVPMVYAVTCFGHWSTLGYPFAGKFVRVGNEYFPIVYVYNDKFALWRATPLNKVLYIGELHTWTFNKKNAEEIAGMFEHRDTTKTMKPAQCKQNSMMMHQDEDSENIRAGLANDESR